MLISMMNDRVRMRTIGEEWKKQCYCGTAYFDIKILDKIPLSTVQSPKLCQILNFEVCINTCINNQ